MSQLGSYSIGATAVLLFGVALLYRFVLHPAIISPLARVPNAHWSCSISPVWVLSARLQSRENKTLYEAHRKHGPVVRIGPGEVSINTMEYVKIVYQGGFDKHEWYSVFHNYG
jgi:hypothetical protein